MAAKTKEAPAITEAPSDPGTTLTALMDQMQALITEHPDAKQTLRSHPVVSGIAGEIAKRQTDQALETERAAATATENARQRQEMLDLARDDPEAFAAQFLTKEQASAAEKKLKDLQAAERESIHAAIGKATREILGDDEMTKDELEYVATAMAGKPESEVLPAYHKAVVEVLAQRRGRSLADTTVAERLKTERAAWEAEGTARRARTLPAPDLATGAAAATDEPANSNSPEWRKWYDDNILKKRRS